MSSMIDKAAQRCMRARMEARSAGTKLRKYSRDIKDPSLLTHDQIYHQLKLEANLADANLTSANISYESVVAVPPTN